MKQIPHLTVTLLLVAGIVACKDKTTTPTSTTTTSAATTTTTAPATTTTRGKPSRTTRASGCSLRVPTSRELEPTSTWTCRWPWQMRAVAPTRLPSRCRSPRSPAPVH